MSDPVTRRDFVKLAAVGGAAFAAHLATRCALAAQDQVAGDWPTLPPAKVHVVYAGRVGNEYLQQPEAELARFRKHFSELEKKLPGVQFVGGDLVPPADVQQIAAALKEADALFIVHLSGHGGDAPVLNKLIEAGLPTALLSQPFSGHGWMYFPQWRRDGKRVVLLPTSDITEIDRTVPMLRTPAWMRKTRVIVIGQAKGTAPATNPELVKSKLGPELIFIQHADVLEEMKQIDQAAAEAEAQDYWIKPAKRIIEPQVSEIIDSAKMFLAMKNLMVKHKAQAVTSSACMGNPRGCLTFSKLNDLGFVGACEGDVDSTYTMLMFAYAFGVPGFITDPVIDTAKDAMIHFHCTSATKMDGPSGARLPFSIRSQNDTKGGVALEVDYRVGQRVTCAKLVNLDTMVISPGTITEISQSTLACRTQFTTRVPDANRMFLDWGAGVVKGDVMTLLHRVVFYGDYLQQARRLGDLMGFKVIEEGGAA